MKPTEEQILEWKREFGTVYRVHLEGEEVFYRRLSVGDFIRYQENGDIQIVPRMVILNGINLNLPGSILKLSNHVLQEFDIQDKDELTGRIIRNRDKVRGNLLLLLIGKLCAVYPSYTPDILKKKSLDDLLELLAIAEATTGQEIYNTMSKSKIPTARPSIREDAKFSKPPVTELMEASAQKLAERIRKETGKVPSKFTKPSVQKPGETEMQKQMRELQEALNA